MDREETHEKYSELHERSSVGPPPGVSASTRGAHSSKVLKAEECIIKNIEMRHFLSLYELQTHMWREHNV